MIGRYSNLNVYHEIFKSKDFYKLAIGFALIPLAFAVNQIDITIHSKLSMMDLVLICSIIINGVPIIIEAVKGLINKQINVDELVSIAVIACVLNGNFLEAAIVSSIMVCGALIEEAVSDSARNAIQRLIEITPETAVIERKGREVEVKVSEIKIGDILLVRAGETIPVDGIIVDGITSIDEASITGESIPVNKKKGSGVYAGTTCVDGFVKITAQKIGDDSTFGKIIQMVKAAELSRTDSAKIVDKSAKWFSPVIISIAILTYLITKDTTRAITVLIVGCPCSFLLAGPVATVAAIGRAAKAGILIKGGKYLENIASSTAFYFDKTGTITNGEPVVAEIFTENNFSKKDVISFAAGVEHGSLHPIALAIIKKSKELNCKPPEIKDITSQAGIGISGFADSKKVQIKTSSKFSENDFTTVSISVDGVTSGYICLEDKPRLNTKKTILSIKKAGILDIAMISGDQHAPVKKIADEVGIETYFSCQKPEDKLDIISSYKKGNLIYVGDGVNDAPALKISDTGIAMGFKGSDVALETADIVLLNDTLEQLPFLILLSKKMSRIIKINIGISFLINFVSVIAGFAGVLTPILGAVSHNLGSILVVLLSASIRFTKEKV